MSKRMKVRQILSAQAHWAGPCPVQRPGRIFGKVRLSRVQSPIRGARCRVAEIAGHEGRSGFPDDWLVVRVVHWALPDFLSQERQRDV